MDILRYKVDNEVIVEIGKFAILWNEFERKLTGYGNNNNYDSYKRICEIITYDETAYKELRNYLICQRNYRSGKTKDFVEKFLYTSNGIQANKNVITAICNYIDDDGIKTEKLCGCLYTIQRYRNNLMHGIKDLSGLDDQLSVFKIINKLLESILK